MLTYSEMRSLIPEITRAILGQPLIGFIQVNPTSYVFEFNNIQLFISVQKPFSRFHLTHRKYIKCFSTFADQVHRLLKNTICTRVFLLSEDRILCLEFEKYYFIAELMYHQPILAVTDFLFTVILSNKPTASHYQSPVLKPIVRHPAIEVTSAEVEKRYQLLEQKSALESHRKKTAARIAQIEKQITRYQEEYIQAKNWQDLYKETELLKSCLQQIVPGMKSVQVMDWEKQAFIEITLDPAFSVQDQIQARFKKVRKMKKRLELYPKFIQKLRQKTVAFKSKLSQLEECVPYQELYKASLKKKNVKTSYFYTFITDTGDKVLVGKNAKGNQKLTFSVANGRDIWLHVTPMSGSHVVIKSTGKQIHESTLRDAMQLALYFSQARKQNEAGVLITEVKYISHTRTTGKVLVAKYKTKKVQLDVHRIKDLLKNRQ